jgi:hypothetical protein
MQGLHPSQRLSKPCCAWHNSSILLTYARQPRLRSINEGWSSGQDSRLMQE